MLCEIFIDQKKKEEEERSSHCTMTMQYSSRVFDPKKKTMIVSISETKKEQRKSFVRTEEICEEEREKSVHQKRERVP